MAESKPITSSSSTAKSNPVKIQDTETQSVLADLYELVCSQARGDREAVKDRLLVNKDLLDKDIAFRVSESGLCICAHKFELYPSHKICVDAEFSASRTAKFAEFIRCGKCFCSSPDSSPGGFVVSVRLTHLAASLGESWLMKFLLDLGCSVNPLTETYRISPLRLASRAFHVDVVRVLLDRGTKTFRSSSSENSRLLHDVLSHAMRDSSPLEYRDPRHSLTFKLLLQSRIWDVNERDENGQTLLTSAVDSEVLEDVQALLDADADPNAVSDAGFPPLFMALDHGNREISSALIRAGADVNAIFDQTTVVQAAVDDGFFDIADILLKSGADPNIVPEGAQPPLIAATINSDVERIELLIKFGADVNVTRKDGLTALHWACTWVGSQKCLELLLASGANPNSHGKCMNTPMHFAAYYGNLMGIVTLLKYGANPDVFNAVNATPLWYAVAMQHPAVVRALVAQNVTLETLSCGNDPGLEQIIKLYPEEKSVLWVAVKQVYPEIVQVLVEAGYNIWREPWLLDGSGNDFYEEGSRKIFHELRLSVKQAPKLLFLCRYFLRDTYKSNLHLIVNSSPLPQTLKDFIL